MNLLNMNLIDFEYSITLHAMDISLYDAKQYLVRNDFKGYNLCYTQNINLSLQWIIVCCVYKFVIMFDTFSGNVKDRRCFYKYRI